MADVQTSHHPSASRYEAHIDGELAGFAEYQLTDRLVVFTHTEVDERFEGQGVGSALARFALDDVRADGARRVLPLCPFVKGWIGKHPDYTDLVYGAPESTAKD
ncbi:GNAT family N-acetyltransferase [Nocardioides sp. YIM 152315]|uniref:GNAT family N-acetyltransferase n=1 Tax=Nocardioides sp. YIM 152315 TaxID=3031760 RepID=UPI0023DBD70F|nr:GNAT family N-acetyltransferase [Nocardioides sp. YIM 152315]MDF1606534.1 GNAT family N-acetyltransferase [Nocardioides sp. YIM 152315]